MFVDRMLAVTSLLERECMWGTSAVARKRDMITQ